MANNGDPATCDTAHPNPDDDMAPVELLIEKESKKTMIAEVTAPELDGNRIENQDATLFKNKKMNRSNKSRAANGFLAPTRERSFVTSLPKPPYKTSAIAHGKNRMFAKRLDAWKNSVGHNST